MKRPDLGDYLLYEDVVFKVIGIAIEPEVHLESVEDECCIHCKRSLGKRRMSINPSCMLYQMNAKPVPTIQED
jgi:hypothetical protein